MCRADIYEQPLDAQLCATEILGIPEQLYSAEILDILAPFMGALLCAGEFMGIHEQLCFTEILDIYELLLDAQCAPPKPWGSHSSCTQPRS